MTNEEKPFLGKDVGSEYNKVLLARMLTEIADNLRKSVQVSNLDDETKIAALEALSNVSLKDFESFRVDYSQRYRDEYRAYKDASKAANMRIFLLNRLAEVHLGDFHQSKVYADFLSAIKENP